MFSGSKPPLVSLIDSIHEQKNIPRHILVDIVKQAMIKAAQEQFGRNRIIDAEYNEQKGEVDLYEFKTVVEEIEDDETEILLDDARQLNAALNWVTHSVCHLNTTHLDAFLHRKPSRFCTSAFEKQSVTCFLKASVR